MRGWEGGAEVSFQNHPGLSAFPPCAHTLEPEAPMCPTIKVQLELRKLAASL